MFPRLTHAKHTSDYHLWLTFSDGKEGEIDLTEELWGEVFEPLKNVDLFKSFIFGPGTQYSPLAHGGQMKHV